VFFNSSEFHGIADFSGAEFKKSAEFWDTQFYHDANFIGSQFKNSATFYDANFDHSANFFGSQFEKSANFSKAKFGKDAIFDRSSIEFADLSHAIIQEDLSLKDSRIDILNPKDAEIGGIVLKSWNKSIVIWNSTIGSSS
jgi:uncharacterized protein YjbI with pentapeptide repeats